MDLANKVDGNIDVEARKQLLVVKGNAPMVWEGIIHSNLCPMEFGLMCTCGHPADCRECWEKALELEKLDQGAKLSLNGKLYCAKDMDFLMKTTTKSGIEIYECPTCHNQWDVKRNDQGNISAITKRTTDDEEEQENDSGSPNRELTPDDEDYNPD